MFKTKRLDFVVVSIVVFSLVFTYGFMPAANAADSMNSAKDTISDSTPGGSATHVITFDLAAGAPLSSGQFIRVTFENTFGDPGSSAVTCPTGVNSASTTPGVDFVECIADGDGISNLSGQTVTVAALASPGIGDALVTISSHDTDGSTIESTEIKVYFIDGVTVQAHVPASLTFAISPVDPALIPTVNGVDIDAKAATTSINFGSLDTGTPKSMAQSLAVSTNASGGFIVTVEQDTEMENAVGSNINSFNNSTDGTGSTSPDTWDSPQGDIAKDWTYGHMGLTSNDATNGSGPAFGAAEYVGLNGTAPVQVMYNGGVADGSTPGVGKAEVAYTIEISDLQQAGDYSNALTYICTASY